MKSYIKKLLRENLLGEEYDGNNLYGYHVTSMDNLEAIKRDGLQPGQRTMQGAGLYAFYDYDHAIRYAGKGEITNPIIVKFYVTSPRMFLYLNMDIAKSVLGPNEYHLINQVDNYFYRGFSSFFDEVKAANPSMTEEALMNKLKDIEENNTEGNQRTFVFNLIPKDLNDRLNIVWDGYYGLEFRINNTRYIKIVGYDIPDFYGGEKKEVRFSVLDSIPEDSKYDIVRDFMEQNPSLDTFDKAYARAYDLYTNARRMREFEYYQQIVDLLDKIK